MGGHVLADINDSKVSASMNVFPMVTNIGLSWREGNDINIYWDRVNNVSGYFVYRSANILGPYIKVQTYVGEGEVGPIYQNDMAPSFDTYYYRVSVYYNQGEGELSDPLTVLQY